MSEAEVQVNLTWFYPADRAKSDLLPLGTMRRRGDLLERFTRTGQSRKLGHCALPRSTPTALARA